MLLFWRYYWQDFLNLFFFFLNDILQIFRLQKNYRNVDSNKFELRIQQQQKKKTTCASPLAKSNRKEDIYFTHTHRRTYTKIEISHNILVIKKQLGNNKKSYFRGTQTKLSHHTRDYIYIWMSTITEKLIQDMKYINIIQR